MTVYEYATSLPAGTVHLMRPENAATGDLKSICGLYAGTWEFGDETVSGIGTTCRRCIRLARVGDAAARAYDEKGTS